MERKKQEDDAAESARMKANMHHEIKNQNMLYRVAKLTEEQVDKNMDRDRVRQIVDKEKILDQLDQEKK